MVWRKKDLGMYIREEELHSQARTEACEKSEYAEEGDGKEVKWSSVNGRDMGFVCASSQQKYVTPYYETYLPS